MPQSETRRGNEALSAVLHAIENNHTFLIFTHRDPDGDAVGSSIAAGLLLNHLGKRADYAISEDKAGFWRLFGEGLRFGEEITGYYDAALVVDCSTAGYADHSEKLSNCGIIIQIDHHTGSGFGDERYIDSTAAACGELIYDLYESAGISLDAQSAGALYLALSTDTGDFAFSNTNAKTHLVAAKLHEAGSGFDRIAEFVRSYDAVHLDLMEEALQNTEFCHGGKMAFILLELSDVYSPALDTGGIIDMIRNVRGCEYCCFIRALGDGKYKVSLRTTLNDIDVSELAIARGGGGHAKAAGFDTHALSAAAVKNDILKMTESLWTGR